MKKVSPKARSLESDSPLTIAAMACSRMPKWKLRPPGLPGSKSPAPVNLSVVLFVEPMSAGPPRNQGMFWARTFRTSPEASLPAIPLGSGLKLGRLRSQQDDRMRQCHAALLSATASCHHARTRRCSFLKLKLTFRTTFPAQLSPPALVHRCQPPASWTTMQIRRQFIGTIRWRPVRVVAILAADLHRLPCDGSRC